MKVPSCLLSLLCFALFAPSLFGQSDTPPISEEARRHFVVGTTLAKDAKTAADFSKVVSEFKQAVDLAPQLPQARYNLAKAREAAGDYSGAIADLKRYQQFKLSDSEARSVQDKIYTLEAKAGEVGEKRAEIKSQEAAKTQTENVYKGLDGGIWTLNGINRDSNQPLLEGVDHARVFIEVRGHQIKMYHFDDRNGRWPDTWNLTFTSRTFHAAVRKGGGLSSNVTINGDGRTITCESTQSDGSNVIWFFHRAN